jgi:hypothetical protein
MYMNMEEVEPYFDSFDKIHWKSHQQPKIKHQHGINGGPSFTKWFRDHVIYLFVFFFPNRPLNFTCNYVYLFLYNVCKMPISLITCDI